VPLFHLWMIIYAMNRWMILFWSIAKHVRILFWSIAKHVRILFWCITKHVIIASDACCYFLNIMSGMVSKHPKLTKRQARDRYGRFASFLSRTAPPPLRQEVGSSSRRRTAPPPSSDDSIVETWEVSPSSSNTPGQLLLGLLGLQWWMPSSQRGELIWTTSRF
jgi:hypothetical protein